MIYKVHESAIIDEGAIIGAATRIWHWAHICGGAKIGEYCSFGQNVFVGNKVVIGDNVKVQNNVSIYDNVTLENDVFCGPILEAISIPLLSISIRCTFLFKYGFAILKLLSVLPSSIIITS